MSVPHDEPFLGRRMRREWKRLQANLDQWLVPGEQVRAAFRVVTNWHSGTLVVTNARVMTLRSGRAGTHSLVVDCLLPLLGEVSVAGFHDDILSRRAGEMVSLGCIAYQGDTDSVAQVLQEAHQHADPGVIEALSARD